MPNESVKFDRAVDYYDQTRGFPPGEETAIADVIRRAGSLSPSSRVLEIGIGTGRIALPLAAHVHAYYGIDLSRRMMERLLDKRSGEPIYVVEGDATRLPYPDDSFDAAVAVHVFHLIPGWQQVLNELARVLKPGAPLVHAWTKDGEQFRNLWQAWDAVIHPNGRKIDAGIQWKDNETFLENEGWQPVGEAVTHTYFHERTPLTYLDHFRNRIWSSMWKMTDDQIERGAAAIQQAIEAEYPDPSQPVRLSSTFIARAYLPNNSF